MHFLVSNINPDIIFFLLKLIFLYLNHSKKKLYRERNTKILIRKKNAHPKLLKPEKMYIQAKANIRKEKEKKERKKDLVKKIEFNSKS